MRLLLTGGSGFIGTNLVNEYEKKKVKILNLDIAEPHKKTQCLYWRFCDIMDPLKLQQFFKDFKPTHVIHLAARTDCVENVNVYKEYNTNITGTKNVLDAIKNTSSIERVIITSSQYVCGPDHYPKDMDDYGPHTVYGQSKVLTEKITKESDLSCIWTIIRPTNIWGPWHMRYRSEALNVIRKGMYRHPDGKPVIRCYGYIGTVIEYIEKIFSARKEDVHQQVFYVGDAPIDIYEWSNGFSEEILGKKAKKIPRLILWCIGFLGDGISMVTGNKFAMTTSRFRSMTTDYLTPIEKTFEVLGKPSKNWREGIKETIKWLNEYGWPS